MVMIKKIAYKLLPHDIFSKLRSWYFAAKMKMYPKLSIGQFSNILTHEMGIKKGDTLFIHSSMDYLNISFSAMELFNLLLETVGDEGTLIFPAWHFGYRAELYLQQDNIFDVRKSPTIMGLLPELARRNKNAHRSLHPTCSIVAIGKHAEALVSEHHTDIYPCGEKSPYYKMMRYGAKITGLGVTPHFVSFVHCPEDILKQEFPGNTRTNKVYSSKVRKSDGTLIEVQTLAAHHDIIQRNIPLFFRKHIPQSVFREFKIRGNHFHIADSEQLFSKMIALSAKSITIYTV